MSEKKQETAHVEGKEAMQHVTEMIKGIKFAMLTTSGQGGELSSRPMTTQDQEFDGDLWFIGSRSAEVSKQIKANPQVNAAYAGPKEGAYVSISGTGHLVEDRAKLEELWSDAYKMYFDGGIDDPDVQLIKIEASRAEYWDSGSSRTLFQRLTGQGQSERGSVDL